MIVLLQVNYWLPFLGLTELKKSKSNCCHMVVDMFGPASFEVGNFHKQFSIVCKKVAPEMIFLFAV